MSNPARETGQPLPPWRRHQPLGLWWVLPTGVGAGLWVYFAVGIRAGGYTIAATLGLAAVLRLTLPRERVGGLMVRSRTWDVVVLVALSAGMAVLSATLVIR